MTQQVQVHVPTNGTFNNATYLSLIQNPRVSDRLLRRNEAHARTILRILHQREAKQMQMTRRRRRTSTINAHPDACSSRRVAQVDEYSDDASYHVRPRRTSRVDIVICFTILDPCSMTIINRINIGECLYKIYVNLLMYLQDAYCYFLLP